MSLHDVANHLSTLLLDSSAAHPTATRKIYGPRLYSSDDVRDAIAAVTGRQDVKVRSVPREELEEWWGRLVPKENVSDMVEFTTCQYDGGAIARTEYGYGEDTVRGETELVDEIRSWA